MTNREENTTRHPVLFVGAGPGDPDLITVKGKNALEAADTVIYAGSLVPESLLGWAGKADEIHSSAGLHLEEIIRLMERAYHEGRRVVRLHTGDPSLYGAIYEQTAELDKRGIPFEVIPGVTAAFAAAAAMGMEFTLPGVSQSLILTRMGGRTPVPDTERLETLARHKTTMAIYLSMSLMDRVADILQAAYGPESLCAVVYRVGWPDERHLFVPLHRLAETVAAEGMTRQAVVIVGEALAVQLERQRCTSRLYDAGFSHGYRTASGN
jgi:precorrin-4/cobalt-precorrin-4 C11-methyltransferase